MMTEYIKRLDAIRQVMMVETREEMYRNMNNIPAEDVVPIVRCKDCKYHGTVDCRMDIWTADAKIYRAQDNDFCSYGARKDGRIH